MAPLLHELLASKISCAPHVLTQLARQLHGDVATILEVAAALTPSQRRGLRALPLPLPLVPTISAACADRDLPGRDRDLLLAVALSLDDALAPLLAFDGRSATAIVTGTAGGDLRIRVGRVELVDPRVGIWLQWTSSPGALIAVHERLGAVFADRGDHVSADWHRARAALHARPESARELLRTARELVGAGDPLRALRLAQEAGAHGSAQERQEADLIAGTAAAGAGLAREAGERLIGLFPEAPEQLRLEGLSGLLLGQTWMRGAVPDVAANTFRPSTDDDADWYAWTRAAAFGAVLSAERGERGRMRPWLDALREGSARIGRREDIRDPVVALCWLLVGDVSAGPEVGNGAGPLTGHVLPALRFALDGDIDRGLQVISSDEVGADTVEDPFLAGFAHSPVFRAYRVVTEVLLLVWRGDIAIARERLLSAALELPVAIPFAGLAVVLARRLDIAVLGALGPFARALTDALPDPVRIDLLVDRSLVAYVAGDLDDADSARRLWFERGAPQTALAVPGIADTEPRAPGAVRRPDVVQPPDLALAEDLQRRAASMSEGRWRRDRDAIGEAARGIRSPFARGHVESALGVHCAIREEHRAAREHLRAAVRLFDVAGADAWSRATHRLLSRWNAPSGPGSHPPDRLAVCRSTWAVALTVRELDTAMLAVDGASNREIAELLDISVRTVEVHLGRAFAKLDVRNRIEMTALAHRTNEQP